jgi:uncharacterized protein with PQ loop repeat
MQLGLSLAWGFGTLSNLLWLVVFIPQLWENYKNQSSDAVSFHLVLLWFVADMFLAFSAFYKVVSPVLIFIGIYHIILDVIFLLQIVYYRLEALLKNFFKVRAYNKVIDQLKQIETIKSMNDIESVEGIGAKIKAKIEEILETGKR